jgi:3-isopropylmalate/(R)-2-methylmalate dehydratase small subunit
MFNCGMLAIEAAPDKIAQLFAFTGKPAVAHINLPESSITVTNGDKSEIVGFTMAEFDRALVAAGGWVEFADKRY